MGTVILPCSCRHEFQDKEYGPGKRLHNRMSKDGKSSKKARCTVCGTVHEAREQKREMV